MQQHTLTTVKTYRDILKTLINIKECDRSGLNL
jgi:hypothetical protein